MDQGSFKQIPGKVVLHFEKGKVKKISLTYEKNFWPEEKNEAYLQIEEYLQGKRKSLDFPVIVEGTEFEKRVWEEVRKIPYGETITYGELAKRLGTSPRAIGRALNKNPLPLYIPCHRVVAKNGLGGFSAGTSWKAFLLQLERGFKKINLFIKKFL